MVLIRWAWFGLRIFSQESPNRQASPGLIYNYERKATQRSITDVRIHTSPIPSSAGMSFGRSTRKRLASPGDEGRGTIGGCALELPIRALATDMRFAVGRKPSITYKPRADRGVWTMRNELP